MHQEIIFGGPPPGSRIGELPQSTAEFRKLFGAQINRRPEWVKILESKADEMCATPAGKATYGDPEYGASLPQAWRLHRDMLNIRFVCLVATGRPATSTDDIDQVSLIAPGDLLQLLARGSAMLERFSAPMFVYDGRAGHAITLLGHDPEAGEFLFADPWPGKSLLCAEYNVAGVDAWQDEERRWHISEGDLALVLFAVFLFPEHWEALTSRSPGLSYRQLGKSDFFSFFHLREGGRSRDEAGTEFVWLSPGGQRSEFAVRLELSQVGFVGKASIILRRAWAVGPPWGINPLALDPAKSFLGTFLPLQGPAPAETLVKALLALRERPTIERLAAIKPGDSLTASEMLQLAYIGVRAGCAIPLEAATLSAQTITLEGEPWLQLDIIPDEPSSPAGNAEAT